MVSTKNITLPNGSSIDGILQPLLKTKCGGRFIYDKIEWEVQEITTRECLGDRIARDYTLQSISPSKYGTIECLDVYLSKYRKKWGIVGMRGSYNIQIDNLG